MHTVTRRVLTIGCAVLCASSCSTIKPKRITPGNDATAVGLRYYETRPFLVVRKPYPIASEPFLVHGLLSNDGKNFYVTDAPSELAMPAHTQLKIGQTFAPPPSQSQRSGGATAQSEAAPTDPAKPPEPATDGTKPVSSSSACQTGAETKTTGDAAKTETKQIDCKDTSGKRLAFSSISLETDLTGTAIVPINELFSIIYLPDYDREFYVESQARWGLSKLHITRGPGGTLLAYNAEVDNTAVVKPLFDAWNALVSAATKAAVIKIEPKAQSERVDAGKPAVAASPQGTLTTIRIHRVKFAVPGIYPFVKPQEAPNANWKGNPPVRTDSRALLPSYPYQVPYDYFTVLIAEPLLDPAGGSALLSQVNPGQSAGGDGAATRSTSEQGAQNCSDKKLLSANVKAASISSMLDGEAPAANVKVTSIAPGPATDGCISKLAVTISGTAEQATAVQAILKRKNAGVDFEVKAGG